MTQEQKKRVISGVIFCTVLFPLFVYLGYGFGSLWSPALAPIDISNIQEKMQDVFLHPSLYYYNEKTIPCVLFALLIWLIIALYIYAEASRKLMPGKEQGTQKWMSVKKFNKEYADKENEKNKILSKNLRMSYSSNKHLRNNNIFVVGGAGAGKTAFFNTPNLLQLHGSNIYTDPKGGMLEECGNYLEKNGTRVYHINLCEMNKSMRYNPFTFVREEQDIFKLITNLIANTTPGNVQVTADPFWEKAEKLYLQAIFKYVWLECPRYEVDVNGQEVFLDRNFRSVLYLLNEAKVSDDEMSPLDYRFEELEKRDSEHSAVLDYHKCMRGAGDTIRSIIISANARFGPFQNESLLRILDDNDIPIAEFGIGANADGKTKSALFMIIPDDDDTFNFIPGMLYTQLFQELYYQARFFKGNKLPIDVGFWFDEFANIKMPANFEKILATCRSRNIYCVPILQSLAQIKTLFKEAAWEGVVGNCDTFIYLGGNEASTHEYISKLLGKWTIDKRSEGETIGGKGGSSRNYDVLGRELMDQAEMRTLPNDECIVLVRGEYPVKDKKWYPWEHKIYDELKSCGEYTSRVKIKREESGRLITIEEETETDEAGFEIISGDVLEYYRKQAENFPDRVEIINVSLESLLDYDFDEMPDDVSLEELKKLLEENSDKLDAAEKDDMESQANDEKDFYSSAYRQSKTILDLTMYYMESDYEIPEYIDSTINSCIAKGVDKEQIMFIINPTHTPEQMQMITEKIIALQ